MAFGYCHIFDNFKRISKNTLNLSSLSVFAVVLSVLKLLVFDFQFFECFNVFRVQLVGVILSDQGEDEPEQIGRTSDNVLSVPFLFHLPFDEFDPDLWNALGCLLGHPVDDRSETCVSDMGDSAVSCKLTRLRKFKASAGQLFDLPEMVELIQIPSFCDKKTGREFRNTLGFSLTVTIPLVGLSHCFFVQIFQNSQICGATGLTEIY